MSSVLDAVAVMRAEMTAKRPDRISLVESKVLHGDCLELIPRLPDASVDIVVTSPPYWGQRESLLNGTEEDPRDYISFLQAVFTAILPKLKLSGIVWLNLGDSYNTPINWGAKDHKYSSLGADQKGFGPDNAAYTSLGSNVRRLSIIRQAGYSTAIYSCFRNVCSSLSLNRDIYIVAR